MDKKKILWIAAAVVGVTVLAAGGFVGYRIYSRGQLGFRGGPGRDPGSKFPAEGQRVLGEVVAVTADLLTIVDQEGQQLSFALSEGTEYISQDNALSAVQDLESGMQIFVFYTDSSEGGLNALVIGNGQAPRGARNPGDGQSK